MKNYKKTCSTCKFFNKKTHYCKSTLSSMYGEYMYTGEDETCEVHFLKIKPKKKRNIFGEEIKEENK